MPPFAERGSREVDVGSLLLMRAVDDDAVLLDELLSVCTL